MVVFVVLVGVVTDEIAVDAQIADQRMALRKAKAVLFGVIAQEPLNVFDSVRAGFERLDARRIEGDGGMLFD